MMLYQPEVYKNARASLLQAIGVKDSADFQRCYVYMQKYTNPSYAKGQPLDHCRCVRSYLFQFIEKHVPLSLQFQAQKNVYRHLTCPILKRQQKEDVIQRTFKTCFDSCFNELRDQERDFQIGASAKAIVVPEADLDVDIEIRGVSRDEEERRYEQATDELMAFLKVRFS